MNDLLNAPVIKQSDKTNANNTVEDRCEGKITSNLIQSLKKEAFSFFFYFLQILYFVFLLNLQKHITVVYSMLQKYNLFKTQ